MYPVFRICLLLLFLCTSALAQDSLLLYEQFNDNNRHWTTGRGKGYDCTLAEGFYSMHSTIRDYGFKTCIQANIRVEEENYLTEALLMPCKKEDVAVYGLVLGMYADQSEYVLFLINQAGQYKVVHYLQQHAQVLKAWTNSGAIHKHLKNKLGFKREYNCGRFYINNEEVFASCYFNGGGYNFGFYVEGDACVNADYLSIKKWPKSFPVVEEGVSTPHKEHLGSGVNTKYTEVSPFISYDGKTLYFSRTGDPNNNGGEKDFDIWYSTLDAKGQWQEARNAGSPLNNGAPNAVQSVSPDNNLLLLANGYKPDGSADGNGLSYSNYQINGWEVPKKVSIKNFVNHNEFVDYFLSSDNKFLLCAIDNGKTFGQKDIFVCFLQSANSFSEPLNLGKAINTPGDEFGIYLAADNKTLYFSSYGHESYGSADVFISKRLDDGWTNWSRPLNMGSHINSTDWDGAFKISAKGDYAYLSCKGRQSIGGSEDIYRVKLSDKARPEPVLLIKGRVMNVKDQQPMGARITYSDLSDNKELGLAASNPQDGTYTIILPAGKTYSFLADKGGFYAISEHIKTDSLSSYVEIERDLYLAPIEAGQTIRLNNIFFEFDKSDLKRESIAELNRLTKALQDYPNMCIDIAGHTDNVGTSEYNLHLSNNRSLAVMNYLLKQGIAANRLKSEGFGETKPESTNDTEQGRARNRRVEFTITKK